MTDDGDRLARFDRETEVFQDRPCRLVGEVDRIEIDLQRPGRQLARIGGVGDFAMRLEQVEHALDVGQRLADLAIDDAKEVERHVELDQEGVHQHKVADRHRAGDDAARGTPHHGGDAERDDCLLAKIEEGERGLAARCGILPLEQLLVVAACFPGLVIEILDRLVIEQAVDGARVGRRIVFIDGAPDVDAPVADLDREHDVGEQRDERDQHVADVVFDEQDAEHEADFDQGRQDRIERVGNQAGDRARTAFDVARDAAGLALEVKAQAQRMQVAEHFERNLAHGALGNARKEDFAQFGEHRRGETQQAVQRQEQGGQGERLLAGGKPVDHLLENHGHADIGDLGADQAAECREHAQAIAPEIGEQCA